MPHSISARKRIRQTEKRRVRNRAFKSEIKTYMKRVAAAVEAKDLALAEKELRLAHSKLDRIAKRKILHRNNVDRKKARLAKLVARLKPGT